jgi:putative hemolysin
MSPMVIGLLILIAALASLWFSTLTYSLRELSEPRFEAYLRLTRKSQLLRPILDNRNDLIFITAVGRLFSNLFIFMGFLRLMMINEDMRWAFQYLIAAAITTTLTLFVSVAIPHALAKYAGAGITGFFAGLLDLMRVIALPATKLMHAVDSVVRRVTKSSDEPQEDHIDEEILSVVKEGEREGFVDKGERQMIEAVIRFGDTTVNQVMTARPEMIGIEITATLQAVKAQLEEHGLSRMPVYDGSMDKIIGVVYARDLLVYLGGVADAFDLKKNIRPAFFVPETRNLRDVLEDFRQRKIHMAIVLDEYGGTIGLVTIEDVLEELVGDISDEHEPAAQASLKKLSERSWEADARAYVSDINRQLSLQIPEDEGYDTLGGFISSAMGEIPQKGEVFVAPFATFTVLDAEPQKINRLKIDLPAPPTKAESGQEKE